MSLLHYIDSEVPNHGEWDTVVEEGSSFVTQSDAAAFPERGSVGMRVHLESDKPAYLRKDITEQNTIYVGRWQRFSTFGYGYVFAAGAIFDSSGNYCVYDRVLANTKEIYLRWFGGFGANKFTMTTNQWYWIVTAYHAAVSGWVRLYVDGHLIEQVDANTSARVPARIYAGTWWNSASYEPVNYDFDEVKIATTYPEPYSPTPLTDYTEAARTVVLFRPDDSDSREFADYCVSELDVPRANLCPLPNASGNEALADYPTFQSEVEDDLTAWLALNPTVADKCTCFLVGYGVPGYFEHDPGGPYAYRISATSRLMNFGTAFSMATDNPLYNPATVARLTKSALGGKHLCSRIDADTLQHAKDIIDRSLAVSALSSLPTIDKLFSDDADYRASLVCQHLRIITEGIGVFADDAFVWGDTGTPSFGTAGTRAVFTDDSLHSAYSLRSGTVACRTAITNSYAAAFGNADSVCPVTLDAESFFEMHRIGGTLAEAFAVSVKYIDCTSVAIGNPLMTTAFSTSGYNVYRGSSSVLGIDYDSPVAYLRSGVSQASLTIVPDASTTYKYALRAVRFDIETPGIDCVADFETDNTADWVGNRPLAVINYGLDQRSGGVLRVRWHYLTGDASAVDFAMWYDTVEPTGTGAPDATETYDTDRLYYHDFTMADGLAYYIRIVARDSGGVASDAVIVGPLVADATAPTDTTLLVSQTF